MTSWEHSHLGASRVSAGLSDLEVRYFFTLTASEKSAVLGRRGALNRIGLAFLIGYLKMTGRMPAAAPTAPMAVLAWIGGDLGLPAPAIASLRTLYRRRQTRTYHGTLARQITEFRELSSGAKSQLIAYLRRECLGAYDTDVLMGRGRVWLYDRRIIAPGSRFLRKLCRDALRRRERDLASAIRSALGAEQVNAWALSLAATMDSGITRHEWLRTGPRRKSPSALAEQAAKVTWLIENGADSPVLRVLPDDVLGAYAHRVWLRRPGSLRRISEPQRSLEIACFLRQQLLRNSDLTAELFCHRVTDHWRQAHEQATTTEARKTPTYRQCVVEVHVLVSDPSLADGELRSRISALVEPLIADARGASTRVMAARHALATRSAKLDGLLSILDALEITVDENHPLACARSTLAGLPRRGAGAILPPETENVFGSGWASLIAHEDRSLALGVWRAATALLIKRSLANGSASIPHSDRHRAPEEHLVPSSLWDRDRGRFIRDLGVPPSSAKYLDRIEAGISVGLAALAEAVEDDAVRIERGRLKLPRPKAAPVDPAVGETRRAIMALVGEAELPDVIVDVDTWTGFSSTLLGRAPRSTYEQVTVYAALLALGSDLEAADIGRMVLGVSSDSVERMMRAFETARRLRAANDSVAGFLRGLDIARLWAPGTCASADMMSLDATRQLWNARLDPRRRRYAVGTYTHVLDQWGLIYDQPIVLNRRQAGAAIEGVLRQGHAEIERLAVDTHGMTHFSMALGKLLGFDICPRLAGLSKRKLYLFRDTAVPDVLEPIVSRTLSRRHIALGWDGLLRLAASTQGGRCSAVWALDRYGSAARGNPVFKAGDMLGKLLRSLYLCDFFSQLSFQTEINALLSRGEAVHVLQRALHNGSVKPKHGRSTEQAAAISGALSLLTNIVMAWNAAHMDAIVRNGKVVIDADHLRHIAPIHHAHINMRGTFSFDLNRESHADPRIAESGAPR